ncbi:MAG: oligosaccharide flippase family protein [Ignavibacteria bacterium]
MNTTKPYKKVLFNASWLTVMQGMSDLSGLVLYIVLSRYYGPEGIGIYAFGFSVALIAYYMINFGFDDFGIRESSHIQQDERKLLIGKIVSVQLILLVLVFVLFILFLLFTDYSLSSNLVIFSILANLIFLAFSKTFFIPSNAQGNMIFPALSELLLRLLNVGATVIIIIFSKMPIHIAILPYAFFGILLLIVAFKSLINYNGVFKLNYSWKDSIALLKNIWPFSASLLIYPIYVRAGIIIVTFLMGSTAAGIYAPAQKILDVGLMPIALFCFSVFPLLSRYYNQNYEKYEDSAEKYFRAVFIIASVLLWVLYYIFPIVIVPLLGKKFIDSIILVKYFAIVIFFFAISTGFHRLFLASSLHFERIKCYSSALAVNLAMDFILIPMMGAKGAVVALMVSEFVLNLSFAYVLYKKVHNLFYRLMNAFKEFMIAFSIAFLADLVITYLNVSDWYAMPITFILFIVAIFTTGFFRKFDINFS